ncbi:MAG: tetratricopeptide repeat protein [Chloroflexota bacterium]
MSHPITYIPIDRRHAIASEQSVSEWIIGSTLFADISGFTPLTEALVNELGPNRGAEELTRILNQIFDAIINDLHQYGGSVMTFSGDAITCWLKDDDGLKAIACALAMQKTMAQFVNMKTPSGASFKLAMKTAVSTGPVRRFVIGSPDHLQMDVLTGETLVTLAEAEQLAGQGELLVDPATANRFSHRLAIDEWRNGEDERRFAVVSQIDGDIPANSWDIVSQDSISLEIQKSWLLRAIYGRVHSGTDAFLAELRPISVLFLRFGDLDYDEDKRAGEKLDSFIQDVQTILARYEANVLQVTIGDKGSYLYAAFGAPIIHEDDADRAAAAALELRTAATRIHKLDRIQIGLTTGPVWAGAYGGQNRRTYGVLGDIVNLSARLMMSAEHNQILASREFYQATQSIADWDSLPKIKVKGKAESIEIFALKQLKKPQYIGLQAAKYAFPMVGRQKQIEQIGQHLDQTLTGEGQIAAINGEAGIGKSRLLADVIGMVNERGVIGLGGECQSYGTNSSYLVWQSIWRTFFNVDVNLPQTTQIELLTRQLEVIDPELLPRLPLLGAVLGITIPDNEFTQSFDAKLRKDSLHSLLVECLQVLSKQRPYLIVLEDCHWMDPLSIELLDAVARAVSSLPVLILMAYRPDEKFISEIDGVKKLDYFTEILLKEFSEDETNDLVKMKLAQLGSLVSEPPVVLIQQVSQRTQGNPFYIEELLNYLHDRNIDPGDANSLATIDLPASLHSLVLSRIDQLDESERITIKVASVIGRLFKAAMLYGVYPQRDDVKEIQADLERLTQLDMTIQDFETPELTYLFKNVVTREVTYENLPFETRATIHNQVGKYIEKTYPDNLAQYIDLLVHHYTLSHNQGKKRQYLQLAGFAAQKRFANETAIDYFSQLLPMLTDEEKLEILLELGQVYELVGNWDQARTQYQQLVSLAEAQNNLLFFAKGQTMLADLFRKRGDYQQASHLLMQARSNFESIDDKSGVGETLRIAGTVAAQQGDFEASKIIYNQSLDIQRELDAKGIIAALLSNLGIVARYEGNYDEARRLNEEALGLRRQLSDQRAISISLNNLGNLALDQGDFSLARHHMEEALEIMRKIGDTGSIAITLNNLGNVLRDQHDYKIARKFYNEGLEINATLGNKWALAYLFEDIGCLEAMELQPERASQLIGAAALLREEIGAPLSDAEHTKLMDKLSSAKTELAPIGWTLAFLDGQKLDLKEAIRFASN